METIIEAINRSFEFMSSGIFEFIAMVLGEIQYYFVLWSIKAKIFFLATSWEVSKTLLANFGISSAINSAWGSIDTTVLNYATFFRLPEALMILIQAGVTKLSFRFI